MKPRHTLDNNLYVLSPISEWVTSYYVHDAQGNEMATYNIHGQENNVRALHLKEQYIYGSSRIGAVDNDKEINSACDLGLNTYGTATIKRSVNGQPSFVDPITVKIGGLSITNPNETYHSFDELESAINRYVSTVDYIAYKDPSDPFNKLIIRATVYGGSSFNGPIRTISVTGNISVDKNFEEGNFVTCRQQNVRGMKRYEITNYLGNVHAVLTDRKSPVQDLNNPSRVAFYQAEVVSYTDYYPFGMTMPGRSSNSEAYNRGYQGSLKDNEIAGNDNHYTTFFRELDPRLGRWWSIDPKTQKMPWQSPYCSMDNNPIGYNDVLGDDVELTGEAKEVHESKYNKTVMKRGFMGFGKLKERENKSYNKEYAELYDKLNNDHSILVRAGDSEKKSVESAVTPNGYDEKNRLVLDITWAEPNEVHGGSKIHNLMEEMYHTGQVSDQGEIIDGKRQFVYGSIKNEVAAKEFSTRTGGSFSYTWENSAGYKIPTQMSVMSGRGEYDKAAYLKKGVDLIGEKTIVVENVKSILIMVIPNVPAYSDYKD